MTFDQVPVRPEEDVPDGLAGGIFRYPLIEAEVGHDPPAVEAVLDARQLQLHLPLPFGSRPVEVGEQLVEDHVPHPSLQRRDEGGGDMVMRRCRELEVSAAQLGAVEGGRDGDHATGDPCPGLM